MHMRRREPLTHRTSVGVSCRVAALVFASLAGAARGSAQIMSNPAQWYINNQIYSSRVFNSTVANGTVTRGARSAGGARPTAPAPDITRFREQPNSPLPAMLSANNSGVARTPDEARKLFASYISLYKETATRDGFPANDLAYAFMYFVVNNYQIVHDLMNVPYEKDPRALRAADGFDRITAMSEKQLLIVTKSQERTIFQQFRTRLASRADIRAMTDAQKQESAELLATLFGVNYAAYMQGIDRGDARLAQQARDMAREGLEKLLGVPMQHIRINSAGLAP
jgi:hypothetical protein